jgi:1,4-alpha-glucan branching enzyme
MATHPGKNLLFMGADIAQFTEWKDTGTLDWNLLAYPAHSSLKNMVMELNRFYRDTPSLWENDFSPEGFEWIDGSDYRQSVISYIRWDKKREIPVVAIINFTPVQRDNYTVGVPFGGTWVEIFNSDRPEYGGGGWLNENPMKAVEGLYHNKPYNVSLRLPGLGVTVLKPEYC